MTKPSYPKYPWAILYDLESRGEKAERKSPKRGRSSSVVAKKNRSYMLTFEEIKLIGDLHHLLGRALHPANVTKSQVIGAALRVFETTLLKQVDHDTTISSWEQLAEILLPESVDNSVE
jgi:hypothetical protein